MILIHLRPHRSLPSRCSSSAISPHISPPTDRSPHPQFPFSVTPRSPNPLVTTSTARVNGARKLSPQPPPRATTGVTALPSFFISHLSLEVVNDVDHNGKKKINFRLTHGPERFCGVLETRVEYMEYNMGKSAGFGGVRLVKARNSGGNRVCTGMEQTMYGEVAGMCRGMARPGETDGAGTGTGTRGRGGEDVGRRRKRGRRQGPRTGCILQVRSVDWWREEENHKIPTHIISWTLTINMAKLVSNIPQPRIFHQHQQ